MLRLVMIFGLGFAAGMGVWRSGATDACLDLGGRMEAGVCRGVDD